MRCRCQENLAAARCRRNLLRLDGVILDEQKDHHKDGKGIEHVKANGREDRVDNDEGQVNLKEHHTPMLPESTLAGRPDLYVAGTTAMPR